MPFRPRAGRLAALCLAALLAPAVPVQAQEMTDLMSKMDKPYASLVRLLVVFPVQELGNPPFDAAAQEAATIAGIIAQVPKTGAFPGDADFLKRARVALEAARETEAAARAKQMDGALAALLKLRGACASCHKDFRF